MVRGRTLQVGKDPVDLAQGTRQSGVAIQLMTNHGPLPVWIGEVGDGYRLDPGKDLPGALTLGSTDDLTIVADVSKSKAKKKDEATSEIHVVLSYEAVIPAGG